MSHETMDLSAGFGYCINHDLFGWICTTYQAINYDLQATMADFTEPH